MNHDKIKTGIVSLLFIAAAIGVIYFFFFFDKPVTITEGTFVYHLAEMYKGVPL